MTPESLTVSFALGHWLPAPFCRGIIYDMEAPRKFSHRNVSGIVYFSMGKCDMGFCTTPPPVSSEAPDSPTHIYAAAFWVMLAVSDELLKFRRRRRWRGVRTGHTWREGRLTPSGKHAVIVRIRQMLQSVGSAYQTYS